MRLILDIKAFKAPQLKLHHNKDGHQPAPQAITHKPDLVKLNKLQLRFDPDLQRFWGRLSGIWHHLTE